MLNMFKRVCILLICLVNGIAPGPVFQNAIQSSDSFQQAQQRCLLQYNPSPSDIADAVSFLISAKAITGQTIFVDAGDRFNSRLVD
jgi:NAD(P)-dependent dehydrogenase (short-subunit alcohol dehydrogenase family)